AGLSFDEPCAPVEHWRVTPNELTHPEFPMDLTSGASRSRAPSPLYLVVGELISSPVQRATGMCRSLTLKSNSNHSACRNSFRSDENCAEVSTPLRSSACPDRRKCPH